MNRWAKYAIVGSIIALAAGQAHGIAQEGELEPNLKAAFLYNFTKYIDWPPGPDDGEFVIGVIGSSSVETALSEIAKTGTVDGRKIVIRHIDRLDQIGGCQMLFVCHKRHFSLREVLSKVSKGELAVAEENGAAADGAGLNFVLAGDKLKFEANIRSLSASGLKVSSQLLKLAIIVKK